MRILILGHADAEGFSEALTTRDGGVVVFTEADLEKAKMKHIFPEGVKHLKAYRLDEQSFVDNAVFISDDVARTYEDSTKREAVAAAAQAERNKIVALGNKPIADAQARVQSTARARNELMGKLHAAKARLQAHDATPETLRGKLHAKTVEELQRLILGDPEKKIAGLESQVAEAVAAYDAAAKTYDEIVKPLNQTPEPKSQLVEA